MTPEGWFKVAFGAAFITVAALATRAARRATARHGGGVNQLVHEVRGLIAVRAGLGLVFYAALMLWLFGVRGTAWMYLPLGMPVRWAGVAFIVPTILWIAWAFDALGTNYRGGVGLYDAHELVTTGPYRFVRHPIYLGFIAAMLCATLLTGCWVLGLSGLVLVLSIPAGRLPREEAELAERFEPAWEDYRSRTGAFIPRPPPARR